jgi:cystatin-A/B
MLCGGMSSTSAINPEFFAKIVSLKAGIQAQAGMTFTTFEPVSYKSQVVAGMNYRVKIRVDDGKFIHAKIYEPLPCYNKPIQINDVILNKTETDEI